MIHGFCNFVNIIFCTIKFISCLCKIFLYNNKNKKSQLNFYVKQINKKNIDKDIFIC